MSEDTYQVQTSKGQEETVTKQAHPNMEIARFNIPHNLLVGKIAPNCILGSNFVAKIDAEVDSKTNMPCLHQRDKISLAPVREETCNKKKKKKLKSRKLSLKLLDD